MLMAEGVRRWLSPGRQPELVQPIGVVIEGPSPPVSRRALATAYRRWSTAALAEQAACKSCSCSTRRTLV